MPDARVLVVDDERSMRDLLAIMLKQEGHDVAVVEGGAQAIETLSREVFDLIITDLRMREVDGLAVLRAAKEHSPETVVVVITAFASTETAVEAMKLGAYDYITKPFKMDEIKLVLANALERKRLRDENQALKRQLRSERRLDNFVGGSRQMLEIFETIRKTADSLSTVLVTGESGTGKELVAHFIKHRSAELGQSVRTVTPAALAILESYRWPGNIRELENVIERALVLGSGEVFDVDALPPDLRRPRDVLDIAVEIPESGLDLEATLDQIEQRYIHLALARTGGVQTRAAELLRVSFRQLRYKLQKFATRSTSA